MSAYIKLSTNEYPRHIGDIAIDPAGEADYAPVEWVNPPQIAENQTFYEGPPENVNGVWKMTWLVRTFTPEELAEMAERQKKMEEMRKEMQEGRFSPSIVPPSQT